MASVFKRGKDRGRKGAPWWISYTDADGIRRTIKGDSDRQRTEAIAADLEGKARLVKLGVVSARDMRLIEQRKRPISEHVADYLEHCHNRQQDTRHVSLKDLHLRRVIAGTRAKSIGDLSLDPVETFLKFFQQSADVGAVGVGEGREGEGKRKRKLRGVSARTYNQHRQTLVGFMAWAVKDGRAEENLLTRLPRMDEKAGAVRRRRAYTLDEVDRLLVVAGPRRMLYQTAVQTGLRKGELARLEWRDIDFDRGTVRVRAESSKNGQEDFIPLHAQLAADLKPLRGLPGVRVFRSVPQPKTLWRDLQEAGIRRIDDDGRVVDFHSLRLTTGTWLARAGVSPQVARLIMRHADFDTTLRHYTDLRLHDASAGMAKLPDLGKPERPGDESMRATGTDGGGVEPRSAGAARKEPKQAETRSGHPGRRAAADDRSRLRIAGIAEKTSEKAREFVAGFIDSAKRATGIEPATFSLGS